MVKIGVVGDGNGDGNGNGDGEGNGDGDVQDCPFPEVVCLKLASPPLWRSGASPPFPRRGKG